MVQALFSVFFSYPFFYQTFTKDVYRGWMINTMADDAAFVEVRSSRTTSLKKRSRPAAAPRRAMHDAFETITT